MVYFVSTQGGATAGGDEVPGGFGDGRGQVWAYDTREIQSQVGLRLAVWGPWHHGGF